MKVTLNKFANYLSTNHIHLQVLAMEVNHLEERIDELQKLDEKDLISYAEQNEMKTKKEMLEDVNEQIKLRTFIQISLPAWMIFLPKELEIIFYVRFVMKYSFANTSFLVNKSEDEVKIACKKIYDLWNEFYKKYWRE
ncbi:MAG: hypothetical protein IJQ67_06895 [Bacilli bacterium]|nr:hypothetical protein [Bacilli bacterium]